MRYWLLYRAAHPVMLLARSAKCANCASPICDELTSSIKYLQDLKMVISRLNCTTNVKFWVRLLIIKLIVFLA